MFKSLIPYLDDLERRIDADEEQRLLDEYQSFFDGKLEKGPFRPAKRSPKPSGLDWPDVFINDALDDLELMILSQLKQCNGVLTNGGNMMMFVRPNYGTGILPSMIGCKNFIMDRDKNTLPNVYPLEGGEDAIKRLIESGKPDLYKGWGANVWNVAEIFCEIKEKYPLFSQFVRFEQPDCQGPLDVCELVWGSDIFYAFFDEPDLVHGLLNYVTELFISVLGRYREYLPLTGGFATFLPCLYRGGAAIRNDSLMNISADMHREFAMPYDQRIFTHYNGGLIHFCGKGDHFIEEMSKLNGLNAVQLSQPELNDMEIIFRNTIDKGINLFVYTRECDMMEEHNWARLFN